jgi:sugar O-acyltransferase (sialic acid O-acetyltransferase NeuD family)
MKKVIVVGAGGHGAEINDYIAYNNQFSDNEKYEVVGFLDDDPSNYENYMLSAPLLGGIKDHQVVRDCYYVIAIANLDHRKRIVKQLLDQGASFVRLVHNSAYVSASSSIGEGAIIGPNANIGPNVSIGGYTLINSRCSLGHDTKVGEFNFISPNVCLSGFTEVGNENLFGINSATIPNISVGSNNKIMAGMVLHKNVHDEEVVFFRYREKVMAVPKNKGDK